MKSMSSSDALTVNAARLDCFAAVRLTAAPRTDALAESRRGLKVTAAMVEGGGVCGSVSSFNRRRTRHAAKRLSDARAPHVFERMMVESWTLFAHTN